VWCIDEKLVLMDAMGNHELTLLGLTPDRQGVWLLDVSSGQLWRQTLVSLEQLRTAFGDGSVLLHRQVLPQAERVWASWAFCEVLPHGDGLLGRTREGVTLQLQDQQPARIVGMENRWSYVPGQTPAQLQKRLKLRLDGQDHAAVLPVENTGNRYRYYVPKLDRLFEVSARDDGKWPTFLGTRDAANPLLFDPIDPLIFSAGTVDGVWLPDSYAHRDEEVMVLEVSDDLTEVQPLLPDNIERLILTFGSYTEGYRISAATWQRLDCIVVDVRRPSGEQEAEPGLLMLDMPECGHWLMSRVDGHLVLADPDNGHSLIVRGIEEQGACELVVKIAGREYMFALEQWLKAFASVQGDDATASLAMLADHLS
jgi:insecticidal toxin